MTGELPAQRASNAKIVSIWWRHHVSSFKFLFENRFWATGPYKRRNSNSTYITTTQISVMGNITTHGGLYNFFECQMNDLLFTQPFIQVQVKENIKVPRHWPLCGNSPVTGELPAQRASNAKIVSIWWRHHVLFQTIVAGVLGIVAASNKRNSTVSGMVITHWGRVTHKCVSNLGHHWFM